MKGHKRYVLGSVLAGFLAVVLMAPAGSAEAFWGFGKTKKENNVNYVGAVANVKGGSKIATSTISTITVISPNGGEILKAGNSYTIKWKTEGIDKKTAVSVFLERIDEDMVERTLIVTTTNKGSYKWLIPNSQMTGSFFRVVLKTGEPYFVSDASDENFSIVQLTKKDILLVGMDSSSPAYYMVAAGTANVLLGNLKISAPGEGIIFKKIGLKMTGSNLSQSHNIRKLTLWDGPAQVGEAIFAGNSKNATMVFPNSVLIPKMGYKILAIKADLEEIGLREFGQQGAFIAVNYDGLGSAEGVGQESGITIKSNSKETSFSGVRMFKSFPLIAKVPVPTNTLNNGSMSLARFKVTANSTGDVGLYKFTVKVYANNATVSSVNAYAYTDSGFSSAVSGIGAGGKMLNLDLFVSSIQGVPLEIYPQTTTGASTTIQIPAGQTRYFDIMGVIAGVISGASVSTQVEGDSAYPKLATLMGNYTDMERDSNNDLIWSPNATTASTITYKDWTNGYGVSGLPSTNLMAEVISK